MSTIFDALKRSDRERQINTTHTMSYSHLHTEDKKSYTWLKYLIAALVLIAVALLGFNFVLQEPKQNVMPVASNVIVEIKQKSVPEMLEQVSVPNEQAVKIIPQAQNISVVETEMPRQSLAQVAKTPSFTPNVSQPEVKPVQELRELVQVPVTDFTGYDNYAAIRASKNIPELHLDILMYHPNESQRKAFINMQVYRQGEKISEGPELLKIGEKGVLLRYQGKDFVLTTN